MDKEKFEEIMEQEYPYVALKDDKVFLGLQLIRKYCPKEGIGGADHDIIYSVGVDFIIDAGITEEDAIQLRKLGWMIQDDTIASFV